MQVTIKPSDISGNIQAPTSKSSMQRACAAALLIKGTSIIHNPGNSNDDKAALKIIEMAGAEVSKETDGSLVIKSMGVNPKTNSVNNGESGLGIRMFTPIIALSELPITINGEGSLLQRPMDFFDEILPQLGVSVTSNNGKLPLEIKGPIQPRNIAIDGSLSSQFLTGLLMAYSASEANDVTITVNNLKSRPYIDLTLGVMKAFGLKIPENRNYEQFYFNDSVAISQTQPVNYTVEGDWSGGAFLLVAGAIAGPITVKGLDILSTQADRAVMQAINDSGAIMHLEESFIKIAPATLKPFNFDATDCPDLFPPLVALASYCDGISVIKGVTRLTHKESNRALTLQDEFGKIGINIILEEDTMKVCGGVGLKGAKVHSRHDHRIAMACAVAALAADGDMVIEEAEAVNKSYPDFYAHLRMLGAYVSINN